MTIKFYTKPYSIFLQRNTTYFLNKPCTKQSAHVYLIFSTLLRELKYSLALTELGEKCRQKCLVCKLQNVPSLNSFTQTILLNSDRKASGSTLHFHHNEASAEDTTMPKQH